MASLRASLEVLLGGPPDQGIALPNERVRQLGSGRMADDLLASQDSRRPYRRGKIPGRVPPTHIRRR